MAREILIRTQDGRARNVRLEDDSISLGRSTANQLCYPEDSGLSRQHLAFERDGEDWTLRDLGSKNGTMVNGSRISGACRLRPGDIVTAGHLTITYADPLGGASESVMFVDSGLADVRSSTTVIASLEGLLKQEEAKRQGPADQAPSFEADLRVKALVNAGRELASHRPLADLFPLILDLAIDAVEAERGILMTVEGEKLIPRAVRGENFRISGAVRDRVLNERESLLVQDAMSEDAFRARMSIQAFNVRSMMAVPLQTNDRVIGLIYVDTPNFIKQYTKQDLNLLTVMANVAAIRLEHARLAEVEQAEKLMARDLEQAAEIQRRLLPEHPPAVPGLDLAGYNTPCRTVGGDYYDFFAYPDGKIGMVVADVSGKGMPAALLMSSLQARVQVLSEDPSHLGQLMGRLNRLLAANCPSNRFISCFFGVIDPVSRQITYCNAGHNPPALARAGGPVEWLDGGGPILGILPVARYEERQVSLGPDDLVVLYSDGVTEAMSPKQEEFGEDRLAGILAQRTGMPAKAVVEDVKKALTEWMAENPPADDITLVVAALNS